jgi:1,4-dihydroxy-6-naphthoate synthase
MFSALTRGRINTRGMKVRLVIKDIETLNRWAMKGRLEATALSFHAYAHVHSTYALLPCGASFGNKYGPVLVAKKIHSRKELKKHAIAIPGEMTSAFLLLRIFLGEFPYMELPLTRYPGCRLRQIRCRPLIHEGQLTYKNLGLRK